MRVDITIGTRFPAHATSMGRVLLAGLAPERRAAWLAETEPAPLTAHTDTDPTRLEALLAETDRDGFALVDQELKGGLRSIAVPLRTPDGSVAAAPNVSLHAGRTPLQDALDLLPELREAVRRIGEDAALVFAFRQSGFRG